MSDLNFDQEKSIEAAFDAEKGAGHTIIANTGVPFTPPTTPSPERTLLQRFFSSPGHGTTGGIVGGVAGQFMGGIPGMMAGAALGNAAGQRFQAGGEGLSDEQKAQLQARKLPLDYIPAKKPPPVDWAPALADAALQGGAAGLLRGAGSVAARNGFPRLAGILGAKAPQQAVLDVAPEAVKRVSTPILQEIDAAAAAQGPDAARRIAATEAEMQGVAGKLARERDRAMGAMGPIQSRMPGRVGPLAAKTKAFGEELFKAVPMDKVDKAFADTPSVLEAASSEPVMAARQQMIQTAMPQSLDSKALKIAGRPIAAAAARGAGSDAEHFAQATGLEALAGKMPPMDNKTLGQILASKLSGGVTDLVPRGGMNASRMTQTTAALLAQRGKGTTDPALEAILSNSPAYRAVPTAQALASTPGVVEDLLRRYTSR